MDQDVITHPPVLAATAIRGQFLGLLGELRIAQTFVNREAVDIEAVFTFPVPLEAVLLGVSVRLDGRELAGQVLASSAAEEEYEDAIASGDRAILVQSAGPGRYTVNVGQLRPGEQAELDYRYALLGTWHTDTLRLLLPTTLAPRYGDPCAAGLAPHQVPGVSLTAERRFSLALDLGGTLAEARVSSPSHAIRILAQGDWQRVMLVTETAPMDRDLILLIEAQAAARRVQALVAADGAGAVALLSLQPDLGVPAEPAPRELVIVADCSGSMAGVGIEQTRQALRAIGARLTPADHINLIAFGSAPQALFQELRRADADTIAAFQACVARLKADLGGTELGLALEWVERQAGQRRLDILLITDGEVWDAESLIAAARRAGHRLFTVGVGAAVAEDLVRGLAAASGGACTLVHPNEDMAERIVQHFERLRAPRATLTLAWPAAPDWIWPEGASGLFAGDTLHRLAGFAALPEGEATLIYTLENGMQLTQRARLDAVPTDLPADLLPRLAAARRLAALPKAEATALAVKHQLVSSYTHFVLRDARAAKAAGLPELRQVPHLMAAGWGGLGNVGISFEPDVPSVARSAPRDRSIRYGINPPSEALFQTRSPEYDQIISARVREIERKALARLRSRFPGEKGAAWMHALEMGSLDAGSPPDAAQALRDWLLAQRQRLADTGQPLPSLAELTAAGVPETLLDNLRQLQGVGAREDALVAALLHLFLTREPDLAVDRAARRRLRQVALRGLPQASRTRIAEWIAAWLAEKST